MSVSAEDAPVLFQVTCVYWCLQNVFVGISCCGAISRRQLLQLFLLKPKNSRVLGTEVSL